MNSGICIYCGNATLVGYDACGVLACEDCKESTMKHEEVHGPQSDEDPRVDLYDNPNASRAEDEYWQAQEIWAEHRNENILSGFEACACQCETCTAYRKTRAQS